MLWMATPCLALTGRRYFISNFGAKLETRLMRDTRPASAPDKAKRRNVGGFGALAANSGMAMPLRPAAKKWTNQPAGQGLTFMSGNESRQNVSLKRHHWHGGLSERPG
jgi:hypothetical protein